ncbi:hypothetical protein Tco_0647382 [Tanacetum coccineum]
MTCLLHSLRVQNEDEPTKDEAKQIDVDEQTIHLILIRLPDDVYVAMHKCDNAHEIWIHIQRMLQGTRKRYSGNNQNRDDAELENQDECIPMTRLQDMHLAKGNVDEHAVTNKEVNARFQSLLHNFQLELERCVMVNRDAKTENERLPTELAQYKGKQKNSKKMIKSLNVEISDLKNQLSKQELTYSKLEKVWDELKVKFSKREDELLEQTIALGHKIKELNNIIVKTGQSVQTIHMLSPKPDSLYRLQNVISKDHEPVSVYDSEETLRLAAESRSKMKQLEREVKPIDYSKLNRLSKVFIPQKVQSKEQPFFLKKSEVSKIVSKQDVVVKSQKMFNLEDESSSKTSKKS